jgi:hypothetical protein
MCPQVSAIHLTLCKPSARHGRVRNPNVLRDDRVGTLEHTEQLTYLLFLKMAHERANRKLRPEKIVPDVSSSSPADSVTRSRRGASHASTRPAPVQPLVKRAWKSPPNRRSP